jgi:hypothetical protein
MSTLVSDPNRQKLVSETARAIFRQALAETKQVAEIASNKYASWPPPCNKTLWWLLVIVGMVLSIIMGVGFRMMQSQLNTMEAGQEMLLQELRDVKQKIYFQQTTPAAMCREKP